MRQPNMNSLRMFDAAARHLNFRLAAEELALTQGAVAQQVRRLEADLGVRLFDRKARGLALTDVGRRYHTTVRRAFAIIDEATRGLRPESRRLAVSVPPSFAAKWLVPRLAAFSRLHTDIDLRIVATEGLANFRVDGVDVAIRQGGPPFDDGLVAELLSPVELVAACSPELARKLGPVVQLAELTAQPLIQDGHMLWDRLFEEAGLVVSRRPLQFNQTALAMDAAEDGQGIVLAPRLLLTGALERGSLVRIWHDARADPSGYYIVHPRDRGANPARDAFVSWALAEAARRR